MSDNDSRLRGVVRSQPRTRRRFIKGAGVAGVAGLAGCTGGGGDGDGGGDGGTDGGDGGDGQQGTSTGGDSPELVPISVGISGGSYGDALEAGYIETWNEEHDVQIERVASPTPEDLVSRLRAGGEMPAQCVQSDVLTVYPGVAADEPYWHRIREENIPNLDNINTFDPREGQPWDPPEFDGFHHIPEDYGCNGWCYNTEVFDEPETWADTLTQDTQGRIAFPNWIGFVIARNAVRAGYHFNDLGENHDEKIQDVYDMISRENEWVTTWWSSGSEMQDLLRTEEIDAGMLWYGRTYDMATNEDMPLEYTIPRAENSPIDIDMWLDTFQVPQGISENERYTAERFLNWVLEPENTQIKSEITPYGATVPLPDPPDAYVNNPDVQAAEEGRVTAWDPVLRQEHIQDWQLRFEEITRG